MHYNKLKNIGLSLI